MFAEPRGFPVVGVAVLFRCTALIVQCVGTAVVLVAGDSRCSANDQNYSNYFAPQILQ